MPATKIIEHVRKEHCVPKLAADTREAVIMELADTFVVPGALTEELLAPFIVVAFYYSSGWPNRALDDGDLLFATFLVYVSTFVSSYATKAQLTFTEWLGLPQMAIQFSVPCMLLWIYVVMVRSTHGAPITESD